MLWNGKNDIKDWQLNYGPPTPCHFRRSQGQLTVLNPVVKWIDSHIRYRVNVILHLWVHTQSGHWEINLSWIPGKAKGHENPSTMPLFCHQHYPLLNKTEPNPRGCGEHRLVLFIPEDWPKSGRARWRSVGCLSHAPVIPVTVICLLSSWAPHTGIGEIFPTLLVHWFLFRWKKQTRIP